MKKLKWWMRVVGLFYILLMVQNLPPLVLARLATQYPTLTAPVESVAVQGLVDMWFLFGTEMGVVGLMLLVASRTPLRNQILVQTVLLLELVRGIAQDVYWLTRGYYDDVFYVAFVVVHAIIIITGWLFLQQATAESVTRRSQASADPSIVNFR